MPLGMLGKYERIDVLGHGVSGIVYLARDTLLNKQIALKEVDVQAGDMRRFLEEARVMDRLRHPNIVRVNNVDRIEGKIVIDMEYVRGPNLQELLRLEGHLPLDRALDIAAQVLDALDYAHRMQTVHRDIKPANILIARDGTVKLVDFGLAEILATNAYAGGAGTYAYMAPEDFAEEDRSDSQSDIWAVGVTLYEMLTGQRPFQVAKVKDPFSWKRVLETEAPTPLSVYLPGASPALQTVLDRALARDKRSRYPTAGDFRGDLLRLRAGESLPVATLRAAEETETRRLQTTAGEVRTAGGNGKAHTSLPLEGLPPARSAPGRVVADVSGEAPATAGERHDPLSEVARVAPEAPDLPAVGRRSRLPFVGRKPDTRLIVEPSGVDFGAVRKGEVRSVKLKARLQGVEGRPHGRVLHNPGWLTVHPPAFDHARQAITLTAHTGRVWETGEFHETVQIETNAGTAEIPVRLTVLKPRLTFVQSAAWYVPLFVTALLPALSVALGGGGPAHSEMAAALAPSAAMASGLLALMLLLIGIAADIGIGERIACGALTLVMASVLGVSAHAAEVTHTTMAANAVDHALTLGGILGAMLIVQLFSLSRWKRWALVLACLGLVIGGAFLRVLLQT